MLASFISSWSHVCWSLVLKVPSELSQQFAQCACTEKPEFGNGSVNGQGLIQSDFNVGIPILGTFVLGAQTKKEDSTRKEEPQARFKFYHFDPILSSKASIEQWIVGLLPLFV